MTSVAPTTPREQPGHPSPVPSAVIEDVLRPMFGARSVEEVEANLSEWLIKGAILRLRHNLNPAQGAESAPWPVEENLKRVEKAFAQWASRTLTPERSHVLRTAMKRHFHESIPAHSMMVQQVGQASDLRGLRDFAVLEELHAPADILGLGWLLVQDGLLPRPSRDVADKLAEAFLRATADLINSLRSRAGSEFPPVAATVRDSVNPRWWEEHRALVFPYLLLIGHALADEETVAVDVDLRHDPEDEALDLVRVMVTTTGDLEDVLERLDGATLRSGVIGCCDDSTGAGVVIMTQPVIGV